MLIYTHHSNNHKAWGPSGYDVWINLILSPGFILKAASSNLEVCQILPRNTSRFVNAINHCILGCSIFMKSCVMFSLSWSSLHLGNSSTNQQKFEYLKVIWVRAVDSKLQAKLTLQKATQSSKGRKTSTKLRN